MFYWNTHATAAAAISLARLFFLPCSRVRFVPFTLNFSLACVSSNHFVRRFRVLNTSKLCTYEILTTQLEIHFHFYYIQMQNRVLNELANKGTSSETFTYIHWHVRIFVLFSSNHPWNSKIASFSNASVNWGYCLLWFNSIPLISIRFDSHDVNVCCFCRFIAIALSLNLFILFQSIFMDFFALPLSVQFVYIIYFQRLVKLLLILCVHVRYTRSECAKCVLKVCAFGARLWQNHINQLWPN